MARIYIGRATGIGSFERHVVLKLITPERANDTTAVQMFLDEARLAASLNHQNVAQVFEVGEDAGIHYLAMEYVHGQDLRALLAKAGSQGSRIPLELALTVVAGAAAGLNHAHERRGADGVSLGIVHRDVSPSNIMIGYDGSVKLLDFGIAKATARSVETQSGIIKGKFAYMAPEQCRGRDVDRRSDVFSLGIILYEITTQHRCFRADSDFDTMHRIVTGDVVRPTRLIPGYPPALEAIVMKALAIDVNQRYQSAHQLLEATEAFAVATRMSLSTMSLGRFMREMFGEHPEPWLTQHRASPPVVPKESTISNTNGTGSERVQLRRAPTNLPLASDSESGLDAGTVLDLPGSPELEDHDADWDAKSYPPTLQPSYAAGPTVPLPLVAPALTATEPVRRPTPPALMATPAAAEPSSIVPIPLRPGSQPLPPASAFAPGHGSGSGPSHASHPGYATPLGLATGDPAYPRHEASGEVAEALQLKPNRRPLFIGLGIIAVGTAVLLAMTIGGSGEKLAARESAGSGTGPAATEIMTATAPDAGPGEALDAGDPDEPPIVDESISIRVTSEPPGADVLLAGKPIGTTPLDTKIKKSNGQAILTVHRGGYEDVQTKIDLSGDFEKTLTLEKLAPAIPKDPDATGVDPTLAKDPVKDPVRDRRDPKSTPVKDPVKDPRKDPRKEPRKDPPKDPVKEPMKDPVKEPIKEPAKDPKKPSCQPPGQIDPFDPRPQCK
ncbi:MAG: protein kinase [Myxococcota bacterium]|nr:protein kinase [Myxococcota bacterium]